MIADEESRERQAAIQARCIHPGGTFVPFGADEIGGGIIARFSRQVRQHPDRIAASERHPSRAHAAREGARHVHGDLGVTARNFGHYYTEHGVDSVISDPAPFLLLPGQAEMRIWRRST